MADDEVGSLGQETLKLLRALAVDAGPGAHGGSDRGAAQDGSGDHAGSSAGAEHVCTTSWCPVCQVVGFVRTNPDVVEEVAGAALHLARTVRDVVDAALRQADVDPGAGTAPGDHDRRNDEGEASR